MDDFEIELRQGFLEEAAQLLSDTEQCFLDLEKSPQQPAILDKIFRLAHNLKGSAKAVGFDEIGLFAHNFESFLLKVKSGEIALSSEVVSLCLHCNDFFLKAVAALRTDFNAKLSSDDLVVEMSRYMAGGVSPIGGASGVASLNVFSAAVLGSSNELGSEVSPAFAGGVDPTSLQLTDMQTVESIERLEHQMSAEVFSQIGASVPEDVEWEAPVGASTASLTGPSGASVAAPEKRKAVQADEQIRVSLARVEKLLNFVGEMVILQTVLQQQNYQKNSEVLRKTVHQLGKVTKEVQDLTMGLRMVPVKQTFQKMQRIVRDTASLLNKKINFQMQGEETELDKTALDSIGDPLVHMIRNAVDHGIESVEVRRERGKSEVGSVSLSAFHRSGRLVIEIRDDGGGIDGERLYQKALEKGLVKAGSNLSEKDKVNLIFHPGFSTKTEVTEVSGRGVGMDVVRKNIEKLQGEIIIDTVVGKGSTFRVSLPLTLAIIDAMIVRVDQNRFVIPLSHVHESVRPSMQDVKRVANLGEILFLRGENLPLYRLSALTGKKSEGQPATDCIAIIVRTQEIPFAVLVDDILGQHQVVIKKLGGELAGARGFSGSAILGDGKPALILEIADLVEKQIGTFGIDNQRRAVA